VNVVHNQVDNTDKHGTHHDGLGKVRSYAARVGAVVLGLFCLFSLWRFAGESDRMEARLQEADRRQVVRIEDNTSRLELEITSDCAFKRVVADLPRLVLEAKRPLMKSTVELATSARTAYVRKRCAATVDPETGKLYGPAPPVYKPTAG
jgi:hypothetical protein